MVNMDNHFDFSTFPTLTTPRLVLRQPSLDDVNDIFQATSDPEVQKYDSNPPMKDIAEAVQLVEQLLAWFEEKKAISWGIELKDTGRTVGGVGFYFWDQIYYKADLGYTVTRAFWRQGIATEALRAVMAFGFEEMGLHRINVDTRMDNTASVRLMARLGFRHEGVRRECIRSADGSYQNWGLFGILEDEYRVDAVPSTTID
jgi:ribosomal-protein-alanine N-acetyltransferase